MATCVICGQGGQFITPCNCSKPIHKHCFVVARLHKTGCLVCKRPYKHIVEWRGDYATTDSSGYVYVYRLNARNELDGPCQVYYPNRQLEFEGTYTDGSRTGNYTRYYESGDVMETQTEDTYTMFDEQGDVLIQRKI
jgi:antitoxin component YwqK of YwqJK toxin-antitoxin module